MPDVRFTPRSYFNAAQERLGEAVQLHQSRQYFAAHYFAGIAAESILRAISVQPGDEFSGNHSIEYWADKAGLLPGDSEGKQTEFRAKLIELNLRWRANQRYMTTKMLDTYLHSVGLDGRIRGDRIKFSSTRVLELAAEIVGLGVIKWKSAL